jgi:hypothetical protein
MKKKILLFLTIPRYANTENRYELGLRCKPADDQKFSGIYKQQTSNIRLRRNLTVINVPKERWTKALTLLWMNMINQSIHQNIIYNRISVRSIT